MEFLHHAMLHDHVTDFARWLHTAGIKFVRYTSRIVTVTVQCGMWLWEHGSEFTKWQHPAMWYVAVGWHAIKFVRLQHPAMWQVALGWHAIEFAQMSVILEFYSWFRLLPYHRIRHVILNQSAKFYPNRTTLGRKQWRHVDFKMADLSHLGF